MDPQATFDLFLEAAAKGYFDQARDAEQDYNTWVKNGGFKAMKGEDEVLLLDLEQDRYLVNCHGVEKWRKC